MYGSLIRKDQGLGGTNTETRSGRASSFWEPRAALPRADFTSVSGSEVRQKNGGLLSQ